MKAIVLILIIWSMIGMAANSIPPCRYEDSENCYWDASTMGNGEGRSFININGRISFTD